MIKNLKNKIDRGEGSKFLARTSATFLNIIFFSKGKSETGI